MRRFGAAGGESNVPPTSTSSTNRVLPTEASVRL